MGNMVPSIFISYARADSEFVDRLEAELSRHGFVTWLDRQHLEGGDDWATVIEAQISRKDLVVVVLSPDSVASPWVRREIAFAQQVKKAIVPVLYKTTQVPFRISELQLVDFMHGFGNGVVQLRTALSNFRVGTPAPLANTSSRPNSPPALNWKDVYRIFSAKDQATLTQYDQGIESSGFSPAQRGRWLENKVDLLKDLGANAETIAACYDQGIEDSGFSPAQRGRWLENKVDLLKGSGANVGIIAACYDQGIEGSEFSGAQRARWLAQKIAFLNN